MAAAFSEQDHPRGAGGRFRSAARRPAAASPALRSAAAYGEMVCGWDAPEWAPGCRVEMWAGGTLPARVDVTASAGFVADARGRVLLVHHTKRGWDIPGGHADDGEDPVGCLRREVGEEAGVVITEPVLVGWSLVLPPGGGASAIAHFAAGGDGHAVPRREFLSEVDCAGWFALSAMPSECRDRPWAPLLSRAAATGGFPASARGIPGR